jgi:hypothetical protein
LTKSRKRAPLSIMLLRALARPLTLARVPLLGAVGATLLVTFSACSGDDSASSGSGCKSTREYFTNEVYGKTLQKCTSCHTPGGSADQRGAKFKIYRETYPDFVSFNIERMREYAKIEADGKPLILQKPLGQREHGGGNVLTADSEDYKILTQFVGDLRSGNETTCADADPLGVQSLDNKETLRRASLLLAGRFPTEAEFAAVQTDEQLEAAIVKLTREELFYDLLRETWNDALLTNRSLDVGVAANFGNAPELYDDKTPGYTPENRQIASRSITQEPMRFIEYVVRNDRPFTDIVSGNYVVANPYVARIYGITPDKPVAAESFLEWQRYEFTPAQFQTDQAGTTKTVAVPVAGLLTTPAFLSRWETTPTNKGRKRARIVLKNFLATDILKFASRPVDSTALTSVQNPTSNSPMCSVCHTVIDPIAGGFRGFDEQRINRFNPDDKWHDDMLPPGFNTAQMPPSNYGNAAMWLGAQIAADPRFGISVAQTMYHGIVGDEPLSFPQDRETPDYADRVKAFTLQNDWFVKLGKDFAADKFDVRKLVAKIIMSPYFRAKSGDTTKDGLHQGLGQHRLLTPELLGRKLRATTGIYFFTGEMAVKDEERSRDGYLRSDLVADRDWNLVYGGIDSGDTTKRTDVMNSIMLATSQYVASYVACRATTYDFTKPANDRRLFRTVELNTVPFSPRTSKDLPLVPVGDNEPKIRETIKGLYFRLLGETVDTNSAQVDSAYKLFVDVWKDLEETQVTKGNNQGLGNGRCAATVDFDKPITFVTKDGRLQPNYTPLADRADPKAPYVPGQKLDRDDNFTIRAWQSVITFMLMDYRFTHE